MCGRGIHIERGARRVQRAGTQDPARRNCGRRSLQSWVSGAGACRTRQESADLVAILAAGPTSSHGRTSRLMPTVRGIWELTACPSWPLAGEERSYVVEQKNANTGHSGNRGANSGTMQAEQERQLELDTVRYREETTSVVRLLDCHPNQTSVNDPC